MGLTLVVDPRRRRMGYGTATLRAVLEHPDNRDVRIFFGDAEAANAASIRCLTKAGFRTRSSEPDFEGMLRFTVER